MEKAVVSASPTQSQHPPRSWRKKIAFQLGIGVWRADQQVAGYLFVLPSLIGFAIFVLLPIAISFVLSFQSWNLLTPPQNVGIANYVELFTRDPVFGTVLKNTLWYTVLIVPVQLALGFVLALAMNSGLRAFKLYRVLYFMPVVASIVAAAMIFRYLFNQQSGLVSAWIWQTKGFLLGLDLVKSSPQLLATVNGISPPDFLNAAGQGIFPGWALLSVVVFTIWKNVGFTMVIYLAALQAVPESLYDAAEVDGANSRQRIRYVTLPMVSPATFYLLIIQMVGAFQLFTEPFVLAANTQGQVATASESLVIYIYQNAFNFQRMGKAAAISWVLFAIVFVATVIHTFLQRRWVHYEAG
jgi:multiple sugar transport system permease protein